MPVFQISLGSDSLLANNLKIMTGGKEQGRRMDILLHGDSNINAPIFMTGEQP